MNKNFKRAAQGGFTLIELIVVIVILGILAATALPKFADLGADARAASLKAAKGSLASAAAISHGQSLVSSNASQATSTITLEGQTINMAYGYPTVASIATAAGISGDDYTITPDPATGTATSVKISPKGLSSDKIDSCSVVYTAATSSSQAATVVLKTGTASGSTTANANPVCG